MAFDKLMEKIVATQNPTVAGLDPKLEYIPAHITERAYKEHGYTLEAAAQAIYQFNVGLIDALCDIVPAVKPQCAFYEMYGYQGMKALYDTIHYAKSKGMYVITDAKRGDIGSTMSAYATAHIGAVQIGDVEIDPFGGDSVTVNAYFGIDGVQPMIDICKKRDKGIFVLVKTSNPSSGELQDKDLEGKSLYHTLGDLCEEWGQQAMGSYGYSAVGAVVGATYPKQLEEMRKALPHTFFLVPGYGAQGGGAKDVAAAFDQNGMGAIVNSSRGIMCAYQKAGLPGEDFAKAARAEALRMKEDITSQLGELTLGR